MFCLFTRPKVFLGFTKQTKQTWFQEEISYYDEILKQQKIHWLFSSFLDTNKKIEI